MTATANRVDPERHREQVRAANRARHRATKTLIAAHRREFDALYALEASKEGVSPKTTAAEDEVTSLRKQVEGLAAQLRDLVPGNGKVKTG